MRRPSLAAIAAAVMVVLGLVGNLATGSVRLPPGAEPWVWAVTVTLAVAAIVVEMRRNRTASTPLAPAGAALSDTADQLAQAVRRQWQREEQQRRIHDPLALPVRWRAAPDEVIDHWVNIRRAPSGARIGPLAVAGSLSQIAGVYQRIPSRRLVILGPAGAGKTILAGRLALDLLMVRRPGGPVPVIFSVASWDPVATLAEWLTAKLVRDYPALAPTRPDEPGRAAALVDSGLILPILDGFDEIPEELHRGALLQLNADPDLPLVVTSRAMEFGAAIAGTDVLTAAAGIELDELTFDDLADYLPRTTRRVMIHDGQPTEIWKPVLTHLRDCPADPVSVVLRRALSTPLMAYLARTMYSDTPGRSPLDLLDVDRFPTAAAVEQHLIAGYLPAIYRHPSPTGRKWRPDQVHRWLAYLAAHLDRRGTPDLAWWQLRDTTFRTVRVLILGLVGGFPVGFIIGLLFGALYGTSMFPSVEVGIVLAMPAGIAAWFLVGLVVGIGRAGPHPARTHRQIRGQTRAVAKRLTRWLAFGLAGGLTIGLVIDSVAFVYGRAGGAGWVGGLALGLVVALAGGLGSAFETPVSVAAEASPSDSLTNDRRNAIRKIRTAGPTLGLGFALAFWYVFSDGGGGFSLIVAATVGVISGPVIAYAAVAATTAWGHWLILARVWLPLTGNLPWAVHIFLADAHNRGVLRQTGAVYQFRHVRLQHHLLAHPTTPAGSV